MILAAGLSPAWQQIMRFDALRVGEVNRAREVCWCASGKVINVAIALAHLGAQAEMLTVLGGTTGDAIQRELTALGIRQHVVRTASPSRTCTTMIDSDSLTTELVENAGPITAGELDMFQREFARLSGRAETVILTGSLPPGAPREFYADLVKGYQGSVLVDASGPELLYALARKPVLAKPNREELGSTLGRALSDNGALRDALGELNRRGATAAMMTDGARPAWFRTDGVILRVTPPSVQVVNPIGCGDSLIAAFAWALQKGSTLLEAPQLAVAAAAANAEQLLPGRLDPKRVARLAEQVLIELVSD